MTAFPRARPVGQQQRQPRQPVVHAFAASGDVNHAGEGICEECGNLAGHRCHGLPELGDEEREVRDRMMGEG